MILIVILDQVIYSDGYAYPNGGTYIEAESTPTFPLESTGPSTMTNPTLTLSTIGSAPTLVDVTISENVGEKQVNDIFYRIGDYNLSLEGGVEFNKELELSCSQTGLVEIEFSLEDDFGNPDEPNPDWISFDSDTYKFFGTAPEENETNNTYLIKLLVSPVGFDRSANSTFYAIIGPPSSGGVLLAIIITLVFMGIAISITITVKSIKEFYSETGSTTAIWSMFNQIQLLIFILIMDTFIHEDVQEYIEGFEFSLFSFSFLNIGKIPGVEVIPDWPDEQQPFGKLEIIEFESRSTFTNCFSLFVTVLFIVILHLTFKYLLKNFTLNENTGKCKKAWNGFRTRTLDFLFFSFYARLMLESYEALCFASISEIREFDNSKFSYVLSNILSLQIMILCVML